MKKIIFLFQCIGLFLGIHGYAQETSVEILKEFEEITDSTVYIGKIKFLIREVKEDRGTVLSISDVDALIKIGTKLNVNSGLGYVYELKGDVYRKQLDLLKKALLSYETALHFFKIGKDSSGLRNSYGNIGGVNYFLGNYEKAIDNLLEFRKYTNPYDSIYQATVYNNLGTIYYELLGNEESAEEAYLQSIKYSANKRAEQRSHAAANLGRMYAHQGRLSEAKKVLSESISVSKTNVSEISLVSSYLAMAEVFFTDRDFDKTVKYIDSVLDITITKNIDLETNRAKSLLSRVYIETGAYHKAEELIHETKSFYQQMSSQVDVLSSYNKLVKLDSSRGNLKGALQWLKEHQKLSNEIKIAATSKDIGNIESEHKYELEQIQNIHAQEMAAQQTKSELFRSRIFAVVFILILLGSLIFLKVVLDVRKKHQVLIKELYESNEIKNKIFTIVSHDLKNEIFALDSSLSMINSAKVTPEKIKDVLPLLSYRTHQTSILLNNLLNWSNSQLNRLDASPVVFDVAELIVSKFDFFKPKAIQKKINLINKLDQVFVYADQDMMSIVTQNLLANAIKFCEAGDTIKLSYEDQGEYFQINFSDTGMGIAPEDIEKLFADYTFTTKGTLNESGTGLGLKICKELVELNQGSIHVESDLGMGTLFSILLPKGKN